MNGMEGSILEDNQRLQVAGFILAAAREQNVDINNLRPGDVRKLETGLQRILAQQPQQA